MKTGTKIVLFVILISCIPSAYLLQRYIRKQESPIAISSTGGTSFDISLTSNDTYFLQNDPCWSCETIGGSNEKIANVGCTICSLAMALCDLGYKINPKQLNTQLILNDGYTSRGWLIWNKVEDVTEGRFTVRICTNPTHEGIDQCLKKGGIPIVKFFLTGGIPHWVAITGKSGCQYMIKDPLDQSKKITNLSKKATTIESVRYVERR